MKYEPVFKFPEYSVFMTDLFLQSHWQNKPIAIIKNKKWEMFLSEEKLKELSEQGVQDASKQGFFKEFEERTLVLTKEVLKLQDEKLDKMNNNELLIFLDKLFDIGERFMIEYEKTEFFNFTKIEKKLQDYIKDKMSFQELLSGDANLTSWPEDKRKLADYIINMQKLKWELRKIVNETIMGPKSIIAILFEQIIKKTGRQDVPSMTLKEIKKVLNREQVKDVSDRLVYSYITYDNKDIQILSGAEAYRKIRELDKNIPKNEVIGIPACKGIIRGKVKVIPLSMTPEKYLDKMEKGDILVSDTTGPEMIVAIEKAAGIVADEGGQMSHAAIVSREFNIPCVVGTKYATEVFKDGDLIEVNANNGVVRKID